MAKRSTKRVAKNNNLIRGLIALGLVLVLGSFYAWWHGLRSNPQNTFWGAINNSLSVTSVTREVTQNLGTQGQTQTLQLQASPLNVARGSSHIYQQSSSAKTDIFTDLIGLPKTDFVRYSNIVNVPAKSDNSALSSLWGKNDSIDGTTSGQIFNQIVLGAIPLGNLSDVDRQELVQLMKDQKVYSVDFANVKGSLVNHRPVYVYPVTLTPQGYVAVLKNFADKLGLNQLKNVNPSDYASGQSVKFSMTVDIWSREITKISYDGGGHDEIYSGYNALPRDVDIPSTNLTIQELQSRIK